MELDLVLGVAALWLIHVVVTLPVVVPVVWLSRRSVRWHWWETAVFVMPFAVWLTLFYKDDMPKTLANFGEAYYLSAVVASAVVIRAGVARSIENRLVPLLLITVATLCAAAVYYATPMWPEVYGLTSACSRRPVERCGIIRDIDGRG